MSEQYPEQPADPTANLGDPVVATEGEQAVDEDRVLTDPETGVTVSTPVPAGEELPPLEDDRTTGHADDDDDPRGRPGRGRRGRAARRRRRPADPMEEFRASLRSKVGDWFVSTPTPAWRTG